MLVLMLVLSNINLLKAQNIFYYGELNAQNKNELLKITTKISGKWKVYQCTNDSIKLIFAGSKRNKNRIINLDEKLADSNLTHSNKNNEFKVIPYTHLILKYFPNNHLHRIIKNHSVLTQDDYKNVESINFRNNKARDNYFIYFHERPQLQLTNIENNCSMYSNELVGHINNTYANTTIYIVVNEAIITTKPSENGHWKVVLDRGLKAHKENTILAYSTNQFEENSDTIGFTNIYYSPHAIGEELFRMIFPNSINTTCNRTCNKSEFYLFIDSVHVSVPANSIKLEVYYKGSKFIEQKMNSQFCYESTENLSRLNHLDYYEYKLMIHESAILRDTINNSPFHTECEIIPKPIFELMYSYQVNGSNRATKRIPFSFQYNDIDDKDCKPCK